MDWNRKTAVVEVGTKNALTKSIKKGQTLKNSELIEMEVQIK